MHNMNYPNAKFISCMLKKLNDVILSDMVPRKQSVLVVLGQIKPSQNAKAINQPTAPKDAIYDPWNLLLFIHVTS